MAGLRAQMSLSCRDSRVGIAPFSLRFFFKVLEGEAGCNKVCLVSLLLLLSF